jgi:hypothetical protein
MNVILGNIGMAMHSPAASGASQTPKRVCVCVHVVLLQSLSEKLDSHTAQDWAFDVLDVDQTCRVSRWAAGSNSDNSSGCDQQAVLYMPCSLTTWATGFEGGIDSHS